MTIRDASRKLTRAQILAGRREALLARSALLRGELSNQGAAMSGSLRFIDRGVALARSGKLQPLLALAVALVVVLRPGTAWRVASRSAVLLPVARRVLPALWKRLRARQPVASSASGSPASPPKSVPQPYPGLQRSESAAGDASGGPAPQQRLE